MEEKKYCQYCGSPIDSEAKFCTKCGKSINGEQNASVQKKVYQQTNFVMDMLRNFGNPNTVIRIISIFSAIFLAIVQFFGMGYMLEAGGWFVSKTQKISAIKFLYRLVFKSGDMSDYGIELIFNCYMLSCIYNWIYSAVSCRCIIVKIYNSRLSYRHNC